LLLGHSLTVRDGTLAFVKIGVVLALATSWPAYRTMVYDLVVDGPAQLVGEIGPAAGIIGADGTLLRRLDNADRSLSQLAVLGPGTFVAGASDTQVAPPPFGGFDSFALGGSRILFLLTAVAGLAAVRVVTGLMLALGPFFIAFLMFDSTRSLFEGWVRVLAGAALGAIGIAITLGLELALLEPWLADILARRVAGEPLPTVPTELFVIACLFAVIALGAVVACARVARAFRLAPILRSLPIDREPTTRSASTRTQSTRSQSRLSEVERSRAAAVASIMTATIRRDELGGVVRAGSAFNTRAAGVASAQRDGTPRTASPVGRSFTRRAGARVSSTAIRRDAGA
jgi:type IV secretion system protein VirB6